jgi:phenylalanyl-tRNA synthetase alpha chain
VRFRPSFFPFTEPSAEIDLMFRSDAERPLAGISGAGQVHPAVVRNFGLDPERYIGFALRLGAGAADDAALWHRGPASFFDGDLRFLEQFS